MKNILLSVAILCTLTGNAQNYLISFTGTGGSPTVSTVNVENLTSGTTLTLNGDDILHLTGTTAIFSPENKQTSEIKIYPNPMTDYSTLEIYPIVSGDVVISVFEITGKQIFTNQNYLEAGRQEFLVSGLGSGLYFFDIKGSTYQYSRKLICIGQSTGKVKIDKVSSNILEIEEKPFRKDNNGRLATVDMEYTTGDILKFTGTSGIYSTIVTDIPSSDKIITFNFIACTDGDGNNYPIVQIGTQIWMAENLKTTTYANGVAIPLVTGNDSWKALTNASRAYCWYNDDINYKNIYGALYTWVTAMNGAASSNTNPSGVQGVCPTSWHLPSDAEWTTLTTYLSGTSIAGGKLKETGTTHWSGSSNATNETGFTALPGGWRWDVGAFAYIRLIGAWWSSMENFSPYAFYRYMYYGDNSVGKDNYNKLNGFSVRCVND